MQGVDVYQVLRRKGVSLLHHANTVTTSCSLLRQGGLVSRGHAEAHNLPQTAQYTDAKDKKYGIWHNIFTDGVDIHKRARTRNFYGPVLFTLRAEVLLNLPANTHVQVTKRNPANWKDSDTQSDRVFASVEEMQAGYRYGEFGQHIMLRIPTGILPFGVTPISIRLDNPHVQLADSTDAYISAARRLWTAAQERKVGIKWQQYPCQRGCKCVSQYASGPLDMF